MADINRNEEKVPAPEEIHGLAAALDQFGADFDPYEYMDTVEDKEQNIRDTEAMLLAGKTDGLKNYLLGLDIELVDFKLEFGKLSDGTIVLADEISPDTCRFWDVHTHEKLDKDRFRRNLGGEVEAYQEIMRRLMGE